MTTEPLSDFFARVQNRTGFAFDSIRRGTPEDLLGGHIVAQNGGIYAVTHGYPDREDTDGIHYWETLDGWRIVDTEVPSRLQTA